MRSPRGAARSRHGCVTRTPMVRGRMAMALLRHPNACGEVPHVSWFFRFTDVAVVTLVNNAVYWEPLEEALECCPEPTALDAEVEFREPAQPGPALLMRGDDGMLW